jgi:hypothetical protein
MNVELDRKNLLSAGEEIGGAFVFGNVLEPDDSVRLEVWGQEFASVVTDGNGQIGSFDHVSSKKEVFWRQVQDYPVSLEEETDSITCQAKGFQTIRFSIRLPENSPTSTIIQKQGRADDVCRIGYCLQASLQRKESGVQSVCQALKRWSSAD